MKKETHLQMRYRKRDMVLSSFPKVMHSKIMKSFCVGTFKIDVGTVYNQPGECVRIFNWHIVMFSFVHNFCYVCLRSSVYQ